MKRKGYNGCRLPKKHNVTYDFEGDQVIRTAIYTSEKAAIVAAGHLRRKWETVTRAGWLVQAFKKKEDSE